jgi:hypothetical protein
VISLGRILLFALLALWLPATMHCRLEAAGFLPSHDACAAGQSGGGSTDCKDDACPTVEEALFKDSTPAPAIAAPAECHHLGDLTLLLASLTRFEEPALSSVPHASPPEVRVAWQFVTRAAPPARAPSLNS